mmetsp:Transcript_899/g.1411  ORF Transcript_899/g.1411 Transcript_899/m.1411 type:complete len:250 (-) Transcript_899:52-801(-)
MIAVVHQCCCCCCSCRTACRRRQHHIIPTTIVGCIIIMDEPEPQQPSPKVGTVALPHTDLILRPPPMPQHEGRPHGQCLFLLVHGMHHEVPIVPRPFLHPLQPPAAMCAQVHITITTAVMDGVLPSIIILCCCIGIIMIGQQFQEHGIPVVQYGRGGPATVVAVVVAFVRHLLQCEFGSGLRLHHTKACSIAHILFGIGVCQSAGILQYNLLTALQVHSAVQILHRVVVGIVIVVVVAAVLQYQGLVML